MTAPIGPGCYEVRRIRSKHLVLFGVGGHVTHRLSSLLPKPYGTGTRNNSEKRCYMITHLGDVEYRTLLFGTRCEAEAHEKELKANKAAYVFKT